jgi:hypothetical protein
MFLSRFSESVYFPIPFSYQAQPLLRRFVAATFLGVGILYALLTGYAEHQYGIARKNPGPSAFVHYSRAVGAMPLQRRFRSGEAFAYMTANMDPRTAYYAIESAVSHAPHNPNLLYQLGIQAARMKDKAKMDAIMTRLEAVSMSKWKSVQSLVALRETIK